jgi:hypothetical protein
MDGDDPLEDGYEAVPEYRPSKRMRTDPFPTPFSRVRAREEVAMSMTSKDVLGSMIKAHPPARYQFHVLKSKPYLHSLKYFTQPELIPFAAVFNRNSLYVSLWCRKTQTFSNSTSREVIPWPC